MILLIDDSPEVREVLALHPAAIMFTMSGADEDYQEATRMAEARRGFRKPVELEELLVAVREAVEYSPQPEMTNHG